MIPFVDAELRKWAVWSSMRAAGGLGYPRQVSFYRMGGGSGGCVAPVIDEDAVAMEMCVLRLPAGLWEVVRLIYLGPDRPVSWIASECGCCRDTVYARLHEAHTLLLGWLNDVAAGVPLPAQRAPVRRGLTSAPTVGMICAHDV